MSQQFHTFSLPNGLSVLIEPVEGVQSAAIAILLPAGAANDPPVYSGCAAVLSDLVLRGAGTRNSRQLTDHMDYLGLLRSSSVGVHHTRFAASGVAANVMESIPVYADIIMRPHLPEDGFQAARDLALQSLASLDDEPRQKLFIKLRECFLPPPLGRNTMGTEADLQKLTLQHTRLDWRARYRATGAIISIAGKLDVPAVRASIEQHFKLVTPGNIHHYMASWPGAIHHFIEQKSEQTHIGIAWPSIPETHADYYTARVGMEILSGGTSSRLFTEVREKRGLVYNVSAGFSSLKDLGFVMGYAGTSNERAQATIDCLFEQFALFRQGVTQAELDRARTGLKSSLIISGESTSSRAGAMAHDWFMRGRIRTLDEIRASIDALSVERINTWLAANPFGPFTTVIVGPRDLVIPA